MLALTHLYQINWNQLPSAMGASCGSPFDSVDLMCVSFRAFFREIVMMLPMLRLMLLPKRLMLMLMN